MCAVLASAGRKLVMISREFPVEVTPFADEWQFQLMFPIGFGLLGVHFIFRMFPEAEEEQPQARTGGAARRRVRDGGVGGH